MTNEPSPRPWRVVTYEEGSGQCDIYDANGTPVCTMGHFADKPEADAALIVDAVNERERLRDIVRRLVSSLSVHHSATMAAVMSNREEFDTPDFRKDIDADATLLREAREAIGEDRP